jgi:hypothetical protein
MKFPGDSQRDADLDLGRPCAAMYDITANGPDGQIGVPGNIASGRDVSPIA